MKWYKSPLFLAALFFIIYGGYLMTDRGSGPMGWGYLAGVTITALGLFAALMHFILKSIIKNKSLHFISETSIVALFFIWLLFNS